MIYYSIVRCRRFRDNLFRKKTFKISYNYPDLFTSISMFLLLPSATKSRRLCFYTCLSVILFSGGGGGSASVHAGIPHGTRPPPQPNRRLLLRTVRILLKCILVFVNFLFMNRVSQSYCEAANTPLWDFRTLGDAWPRFQSQDGYLATALWSSNKIEETCESYLQKLCLK